MPLLGAHMSIAGGYFKAVGRLQDFEDVSSNASETVDANTNPHVDKLLSCQNVDVFLMLIRNPWT